MEALPDILRCERTGEELFLHPSGAVLLNAHNHTNRSDGWDPPEKLAEYAMRHRVNQGQSDHNIPPEPRGGRLQPGVFAVMEVTTREGIDVLVPSTLRSVHAIFEDVVRRNLHPTRPRFSPTTLPIRTLMDAVREQGAYCVHPHYATVEGLSALPHAEQAAVLDVSRTFAFLELNALQSAGNNTLAHRVGQEWGVPLLCGSDAHREERQHVETHTGLPVARLIEGEAPLITRVLSSMHAQPEHLIHTLRPATLGEKLRTAAQIAVLNGVIPMSRFAWKNLRRQAGHIAAILGLSSDPGDYPRAPLRLRRRAGGMASG